MSGTENPDQSTYDQNPWLHGTWPEGTRVKREDVRNELANYSREPFIDVLEALLQARPSPARLALFASEDPSKWAQAIKIFAILGGYTEKTESTHQHIHLHKMSDAELVQATQDMISRDPSLLHELKNIHEQQLTLEHSSEHEIETVQNLNGSNSTPDRS
jgi:hypothetical protein